MERKRKPRCRSQKSNGNVPKNNCVFPLSFGSPRKPRILCQLTRNGASFWHANADEPCNRRMHLVAHSMGNWALRHAVLGLRELAGANRLPKFFDNVFLMAADEDEDAFEHDRKLGLLPQMARAIHVYHSHGDRALTVSDTTKNNPDRLGTNGPRTFSDLSSRITAVDCHKTDHTKLAHGNHQYYRIRSGVIDDVREVLAGRLQADEFPNRDVVEPGRRYRIKAD